VTRAIVVVVVRGGTSVRFVSLRRSVFVEADAADRTSGRSVTSRRTPACEAPRPRAEFRRSPAAQEPRARTLRRRTCHPRSNSSEFFRPAHSTRVARAHSRASPARRVDRPDPRPEKMEVADIAVKPVKEFAKDSYRLVRKCTKPDRKEFTKIALRTGLGFVVMGFVGFFVKLILCVPPVDRIRRSIDRSFPLSARFSDPPPRTSRSPRTPPPLAAFPSTTSSSPRDRRNDRARIRDDHRVTTDESAGREGARRRIGFVGWLAKMI